MVHPELKLTSNERDAISFVGFRYAHGNDLYRILWVNCYCIPMNTAWDDEGNITFYPDIDTCRRLVELMEGCQYELLGGEFKAKLRTFIETCKKAIEHGATETSRHLP